MAVTGDPRSDGEDERDDVRYVVRLADVAVAVLVAFVVFVGLGVTSFLTLLLVWR